VRVLTGVLTAVAVVAVIEYARRLHLDWQGRIVSPHWPHRWIERVDNVVARCTEELDGNEAVRRDIAAGPPNSPPPSLDALLTTNPGGTVEWVRACTAVNLYPSEQWPPRVDEAGTAKDMVWHKLTLVAERALGLELVE